MNWPPRLFLNTKKYMKLFIDLKEYLIGAYAEMRKVTWPTKQQTINYSLLVIGMSVAMALFFGVLDYFLNIGLEKII